MERKEELIERFHKIHNEAMSSKNDCDMYVASDMFVKTFTELTDCDLKAAKEIVDCYEGSLKYDNYLTESEAERITDKFVNQDGSRGPKWKDPQELFQKVEIVGGYVECIPHYNKWALYVTMNMVYSDQNSVLIKWVGDDREKYFEVCYELALTHLKDKDRPCWIRPYFNVGK